MSFEAKKSASLKSLREIRAPLYKSLDEIPHPSADMNDKVPKWATASRKKPTKKDNSLGRSKSAASFGGNDAENDAKTLSRNWSLTALNRKDRVDERYRVDHQNIKHRYQKKRASKIEAPKLRAQPIREFPFRTTSPPEAGKLAPLEGFVPSSESPGQVHVPFTSAPKPEDKEAALDQAASEPDPRDDPAFLKLDQSRLPPLEQFDNAAYETHSPQEWLEKCKRGRSPYFINGDWKWKACDVLSYDEETERYHIKFTSGREKYVRRINLMFDAEDPDNFKARLQFALRARKLSMCRVRLVHFLEEETSEGLTGIQDHWLGHIKKNVRVNSPSAAMIVQEVRAEYMLSMKLARLHQQLKVDDAMRARYRRLQLPQTKASPPPPQNGTVSVPVHPYEKNRRKFAYAHYTCDPELVSCLQWMSELWTEFDNDIFMDVRLDGLAQPTTVEAFVSRQRAHCKDLKEKLQMSWRRAIMDRLLDTMPPEEYNFYEADAAVHAASQLSRTLRMLRLRMADQLREIVHRSINAWVKFVASYGIPCNFTPPQDRSPFGVAPPEPEVVQEEETSDDQDKKKEGDDDEQEEGEEEVEDEAEDEVEEEEVELFSHPCLDPPVLVLGEGDKELGRVGPKSPLFDVSLVERSGEVLFQPRITSLEQSLLSALDDMVAAVRSLTDLDPELMALIALTPQCIFNIGADDPLLIVTDELLKSARASVSECVQKYVFAPRALAAEYQRFIPYLYIEPDQYAHKWFKKHRPIEDTRAELARIQNDAELTENLSFDVEEFRLVRIRPMALKSKITTKCQGVCTALMEKVVLAARLQNRDIIGRYMKMVARIGEKPVNEQELAELQKYIAETKPVVEGICKEVEEIHTSLGIVHSFGHKISPGDFTLAWSTKQWPQRVSEVAVTSMVALEEDLVRMMKQLEDERNAFEEKLEQYAKQVEAFKEFQDLDSLNTIVEEAMRLDDDLKSGVEQAEDFNSREKVFGWPLTEYGSLDMMRDEFQPFFELWTMSADFETSQRMWLTGPFSDLNAGDIEKEVMEWWKGSYRLMKVLNENEGPAAVAGVLRERTDEFKKNIPLLVSLASPALRERHWESLSEKIGEHISPDEDLTLQQLLDMGIMDHFDAIQEVSVVAEKEFGLDRALDAMAVEWEPMQMELTAYRETGTYVVRITDEIITLLDDQIMKVQTMQGSPYIKPIQKRCKAWGKRLHYVQELFEQWLKCQRTWMYLEPIFSSDDIMRQMPVEGRRFASVDSMWRKTMLEVLEEPKFIDVSGNDKLLTKFTEANARLDQIQKGLNDYLEVKRLAFPRFFFLSNDELLEILSQTKDCRAVQPFLGKCFEGMSRIVFQGDETGNKDDLLIIKMVSGEGETVPLSLHINPNQGSMKGNVEMWLNELQKSMRLTVKDVVKEGIASYPKMARGEWVLSLPAQVVLCVSQLFWTQEVEESLLESGNSGLFQYLEVLNEQLDELVVLVRGKLTKMQRTTLGALVVIDVHARDVIDVMAEKGVATADDFEWSSQLRYYWKHQPDDYHRYGTDPENMVPGICNATQMYGYEYLGNSSRLVITPLTDRCYRTLMGAVALMYGGAPAGPAGTGKTETTKDLSKAVAIQCVVTNCSDGLDYLAMAKFFKGLASSGAWACFDEFNRIELEVLSVIAQQILTIQKAKRQRVAKFVFEGTVIMLNPDANCFITMNPGYAGRSELPDNLKALFRPCAMMVPDYSLIAEIKLFSFGFSDARNLARKLTQVLQLSSELLSGQKHYDYGMRAVFSILVRAGALRQMRPDWGEDLLVLSAMNDVNLPKFTTNDLPLFKGITQDLFPGTVLPNPDYSMLLGAINNVCRNKKIQPVENFVRSTIQLYETVQVRHGLMVVGKTFSGKTCVIHTLAQSMTSLKAEPDFTTVKIHTINPKSITAGQLYGLFDDNTHEWTDGILAVIYRNCSKDQSADRNWIVFDGPVDAVWIENMNTVLDDNKKLCLTSGEIIKMGALMTMMFETEDLEEASPATVSRVGMVFMEPKRLGWAPLLDSWLQFNLPEPLKEKSDLIQEYFQWLFPVTVYILRKFCKVPSPVSDLELCASCLRLVSCFIKEHYIQANEEKAIPDKSVPGLLESVLILALIWSVGAVTDSNGRATFSQYFRKLIMGGLMDDAMYALFKAKNPNYGMDLTRALLVPIPEENTVYDFALLNGRWTNWMKHVPNYIIPKNADYNSILVPTVDTVRNLYIKRTLITNNHHVLCTGDTGTGKSVSIKQMMMTSLDKKFIPMFLNFSAQTSANQTQAIIDGKLDKRRARVYGPPIGKKCVIFVDDLNMPAKEEYGAQPPIEILRQWMDIGGWYDLKENSFRKLVDIQFIAAMGPPGGGRSRITQRYVRHFNSINFVPFDVDSQKRIFSPILIWFLDNFNSSVKSVGDNLVNATVDIYQSISSGLLPTPAKSHYTFNLRDLSKVFQGVLQGSPTLIDEESQLIRLWAHECLRVFYDRLINDEDRAWFENTLADKVKVHFKADWNRLRGKHDTIMYGNFMDPRALVERRVYAEIDDREGLKEVMNDYLEDFNNTSTKPMSLVLFMNAIEHVARISRIINQPYGHALLVGVGGSGRKSLTTLAVSISDMFLFQIEISKTYGMNEWREDLKTVLLKAGKDCKPSVFLFSDTQIVKEGFVEDINNILNTGEVPNLFLDDEKIEIIETVGKLAQKAGLNANSATEVLNYFVRLCRTNLHLVLAFSPIGDAFRTRLRMFPSLVNCCTIDWFTEWPEEALRSVADYFFVDVELDDDVKSGVMDMCVDMQERCSHMSKDFLKVLGRYYYITPTSYLELINTFKNLLAETRKTVSQKQIRYSNGLKKLLDTAEQVSEMQEQLTEMQPKLKIASIETSAKLVKVEEMQIAAGVKKESVALEEAGCAKQAAEASAMKADCMEQLAEAIPALDAAVKALSKLSKNDIVEVKAMKKPPPGVKLTMEAVCIMMGVKPNKVPNPEGKGKIDDYWEPSQKTLLNDSRFLQKLVDYDKDNMKSSVMDKVAPYIKSADFQPDVVQKASKAAAGLCKWVHAMVVYDRVAKVVAPKKEALRVATAQLAEAEANLAEKRAELQAVEDQVAQLQRELQETIDHKEDLERKALDCSNRLDRAQRLMGGLGGERSRWTQFTIDLQKDYNNITGDIMISSGIIAYLGVFTSAFRDAAVKSWMNSLTEKNIPFNPNFTLSNVLGEAVLIRQWTIDRLPNDSFSIDNAIMLYKSNRWPLMIDPQLQANTWIRRTEKDNELVVVKQTQANFVRQIEAAVQFGRPVLLENVPEFIDPVLEALLNKQFIRAGGILSVQIGDNTVEYDEKFRLYITTKLRNPHYPPETCVKVNLLNFMATQEGLEDQMLGITVREEMPELEARRVTLVLEDAQNKAILKEIEDKILELLSASEGDILDDDVLITTLQQSKVKGDQINEQLVAAAKTQARIDEARVGYKPIAKRVSELFFCIADLASVDPMYQYSLEWYVNLFLVSISTAEKSPKLEQRLEFLKLTFTSVLYVNVCRSLFEAHKLLFSFLLTIKIMQSDGHLDPQQLRFFLAGNTAVDLAEPNPCPAGSKWMSDRVWGDVLELSNVAGFEGFKDRVANELGLWEGVVNSVNPVDAINELVGETHSDMFEQLLILRTFRPDKVVPQVQTYISTSVGKEFIDPPTFNLKLCFDDSNCVTPLLFVLTPGADPMTELMKLAEQQGMGKKLFSVSLGQGQGPIAEEAIKEAVDKGSWVCLQNCHLAISWMGTLERLCEEITPERTHADFRLWLSSMPSDKFPVSLLQNGVKMTLEPPKGMRANLLGSYSSFEEQWFESCTKPALFKKLLFGLCFFHATVRERCKFGPLGWNIPYEFSTPDLRISMDQLRVYLEEEENVPYMTLRYLAGECNYGGRVTDDKDRRCIMNIVTDFYTPDILDDDYKFSVSGTYYAPVKGGLNSYVEYIKSLPFSEGPELFGLHDNADITTAISETQNLLDTALSLQPRTSGGSAKSWEDQLMEMAVDIEGRMPGLFDIEKVEIMYPVRFEESMNTVLTQECMRFNRLTNTIKTSLVDVQKALKGIVVMSTELERLGDSMVKGWVPDMWASVGYPSLKPLGSWVNDFLARIEFMGGWIKNGKPNIYWISGFFFQPAFLTGTRQNFARKYVIAIDELAFDFKVLSPEEEEEAKKAKPDDGAYVNGLFLEGANWSPESMTMVESTPKELYVVFPTTLLLPKKAVDIDATRHLYSCPVYKTSERRGMLSTTGHSTNYVLSIKLPMAAEHTEKHWIKRGVALLTQLDD